MQSRCSGILHQLDSGQQRNFYDKHVQRRCQLCGVGSFCTEHSDPRDHACVCHIKTFVPNKYHILSREAHCGIPGLASVSEISFAKLWYQLPETEKRLVRSFAGPPGIEDATRTQATIDRVVEFDYPIHGALRIALPRAFRLSGLNSVWDDLLNEMMILSLINCPDFTWRI